MQERITLRDRLAALSRRELAGLLALALVAVGGAGLWYLRSLPKPVEIREVGARPLPTALVTSGPSGSAPTAGTSQAGASEPSPSILFVNSQELKNMTNKVLTAGSGPLLQYFTSPETGAP